MKYKIEHIRERVRIKPDGTEEEIIKVWYVTEAGYRGTREFKKEGLDIARLKEELAKHIEKVNMQYGEVEV